MKVTIKIIDGGISTRPRLDKMAKEEMFEMALHLSVFSSKILREFGRVFFTKEVREILMREQ